MQGNLHVTLLHRDIRVDASTQGRFGPQGIHAMLDLAINWKFIVGFERVQE